MERKESFLSYLNSLDDDYYFFIATMVLGKVNTPYHKPVLNTQILSFLINQGNRENIIASLDETDLKYLSLIMLLKRCTLLDIREFFAQDSYPMIITRIDSLCDRLVILRSCKVYSINPVLEEDLEGLYRSDLLFEDSTEKPKEIPYVDRNVVFAMLNLLSNGSVPVREANAHHFTRTDKLERVFPQVSKELSIIAYETIKAMAISSGAISVCAGRFIVNPEKARKMTCLDSLNLMLEAIESRVSLPCKCEGLGISAACARLLSILKGNTLSETQAKALLQIFTGLNRIKDAERTTKITADIMDMMASFGFIQIRDKAVNLNPAVMSPEIKMTRTSLDSNLVISYYGNPEPDDILYLFADVQVCDKMVSYVISKESYNRAVSPGLSDRQILDYIGSG